jgi:ribosomal protein S18 acetylase RimI-like enzyme
VANDGLADDRAADDRAADLVIAPLDKGDDDAVLPLIADYQRFYGVDAPDEARNRAFFARFLGTSDAGCILGAQRDGRLVGYACLYFAPSSVEAEDIVILNDLYVVPDARGSGVGRRLIDATTALAGAREARRVRWSTAIDNRRAQRLYETMGAERTTWFEYEVIVDPSDR